MWLRGSQKKARSKSRPRPTCSTCALLSIVQVRRSSQGVAHDATDCATLTQTLAMRRFEQPSLGFLSLHARMDTSLAELIRHAEAGEPSAADRLFTAMYADLHRLAERQLARDGGQLTLGATTLLHEAYLSMAARDGVSFPDRARFMGYAARAMRGLLIDYVRNRRAQKRGGEFHITGINTLTPVASPDVNTGGDLEALGEALDGLAVLDRALAELVDLHFFCGFGFGEIAAMRGLSERTVQRDWRKARLLLRRSLESSEG